MYAIISDIHGNLAALEAVVAAARDDGAVDIICLGDLLAMPELEDLQGLRLRDGR